MIRRHTGSKNSTPKGFTIIELMIATSVLAVILVLVTTLLINIGNLYYRGVNQSQVQDNTRTIVDDVSDHLRYSTRVALPSTAPVHGASAICFGNVRYTYLIGQEIGPGVPHVLWRDNYKLNETGRSDCTPLDLTNDPPARSGDGATELMEANSRLTYFSVQQIEPGVDASPYTISVGVAFGSDDLLNLDTTGPDKTTCIGGHGDQFCATASLTSFIVPRLVLK